MGIKKKEKNYVQNPKGNRKRGPSFTGGDLHKGIFFGPKRFYPREKHEHSFFSFFLAYGNRAILG